MKKILFILSIAICGILTAQPTITNFSPTSGAIGTTVTINGSNFNTTPTNNIVFFGATMATVSAASATSLTATVPNGATYQRISVTDITTGLSAYSAQPFTVTFTCGGVINTSSFAAKVDFATLPTPVSILIADLDGDGKSDLAIVNENSYTLSLFRNTGNNGTISFTAEGDFGTGSGAYLVTSGDLDGDGKPDLAVLNSIARTVSLFRNTGSSGKISFAAKFDFTTVKTLDNVSIGDLDGDGKPDLIILSANSNTLCIHRNTGSKGIFSFAASVDYPTDSYPFCTSIGDLDGDGKPDLAIANTISKTVSVFRNTGTSGIISFDTKVDFAAETQVRSVSIGDLDGDGKPDLAVANSGAAMVSVLRNTGSSGAVSFASKVDFPAGINPTNVSIDDLDGDGKLDLAVANYGSNTVSVYRNTGSSGTISFATKVDFTTGTNPYGISTGDLDGDGKSDLAVVNHGSTPGTISVIKNQVIGVAPTVTANASASIVCKGASVTLTGGGADTYSWTGGVTDGLAFIPTATATYTVTGTDANFCSNTSSVKVTVDPCLGISSELSLVNVISIYPNPSNGYFTIQVDPSTALGMTKIEITNVLGEKIYSTAQKLNFSINIDLSNQTKGIYFIKLNSDKGTATKKLTIQ